MADVSTHATLTTGLVSYYDLGEASGSRIDAHGSNDLTETGTLGRAAGPEGSDWGANFTGSQNLDITDGSQSGLDITGDISMAIWVNLTSSGTVSLLGKAGTSGNVAYNMWIEAVANKVTVDLSDNGSFSIGHFVRFRQATGTISTGTYTFVVATFDISTETLVLYIDGSSVSAPLNYGTNIGAMLKNGTSPFEISRGTQGDNALSGVLSKAGVWSKVLTSGEVTDLYNSGDGLIYEEAAAGGFAFSQAVVIG